MSPKTIHVLVRGINIPIFGQLVAISASLRFYQVYHL
jgi:hypothetical protein